jgi:multidrug resistance efflux pump
MRPVSSPVAVRWREFCHSTLPLVVFVAVACAVAYLWEKHPGRASLVGRVEAVHTTVSGPRAGRIEWVNSDLLQQVKKGDVLAKVSPYDTAAVVARLHAHVDLLRAQLLQNTDRHLIDYQ